MSDIVKGSIQIEGMDYVYSPVLSGADSRIIASSTLSLRKDYYVFLEGATLSHATSWYSAGFNAAKPEWIGFDFGMPVMKKGVALIYDTYGNHKPVDYQVQYENASGEWVDVISVEGATTATLAGKTKVYWFEQPVIAQRFRYYVTKNQSTYATVLHRLRFIDAEGHSVMQRYELEDGTPVRADEVKAALKDTDFSTSAPLIDGYECLGYKLNDAGLQQGSDVVISSVSENHTLVFVYKATGQLIEPEELNLHILLEVNESVNLTGYIHPVAPNVSQLVWSSEDAAVVSVDANGKVTGNEVGIAKILVKTPDDSWSAFVRVIVEAEGASDLRLSVLLVPDETCKLRGIFVPKDTSVPIIWSSSNNKVATVNSSGKVTAVTEGSAIITVQTAGADLSDYIYVTVVASKI